MSMCSSAHPASLYARDGDGTVVPACVPGCSAALLPAGNWELLRAGFAQGDSIFVSETERSCGAQSHLSDDEAVAKWSTDGCDRVDACDCDRHAVLKF